MNYRKQALEMVEACICKNRQDAYSPAESNFRVIADLWNIWIKTRGGKFDVTPLDVAQMCAMIKISRKAVNITHLDSWIDDAGYNGCGAGIVMQDAAAALDGIAAAAVDHGEEELKK